MRIAIACRQNRMRSPFAAAILSRLVGNDVYSFGSNVEKGSTPSELVCELIAELGMNEEWLKTKRLKSKGLDDVLLDLEETKVVLCLEPTIQDTLIANLREDFKSKFILAINDQDFLKATDPILLKRDETRLEIYKATLFCIQKLRDLEMFPIKNIIAFLPLTEKDTQKVIKEVIEIHDLGTVGAVINLDFYSPLASLTGNSQFEFRGISDVDEISNQLAKPPLKGKSGVLVGVEHEVSWNFSTVFLELEKIWKMNHEKKTILILPNLDSSLRVSSLAVLGSWLADQVIISGDRVPRFANGLREK